MAIVEGRQIYSKVTTMLRLRKRTILILLTVLFISLVKWLTADEEHYPVVIIGTGLAGLTAAADLTERYNVPVILMDKETKIGGNSIKASSGINGANTNTQESFNIADSPTSFLDDTIKSAKNKGNQALMKKLADESSAAIHWLQYTFDVKLNLLSQLGGHSYPRTHRSDGKLPPGAELINALSGKLVRLSEDVPELLKFLMNCEVIDVEVDKSNRVTGVVYIDHASGQNVRKVIRTSNVIFATGGFGYSKEMLQKYSNGLENLPTTNGAQTTGDGQTILERLGAQMIDMDQIQIHPTGFIDPNDRSNNWKFLAAEALRGLGGILLNPLDGKRFVNEVSTRDAVTAKIQSVCPQDDNRALLVMSEELYKEYKNNMDFYIFKKLINKMTVQELITNFNLPIVPDELILDLSTYHQIEAKTLGRTHFKNTFGNAISDDTEIYVAEITPVVHFTMGGAKINEKAQILNKKDRPLAKGIYGAGEVTGGVHGSNRLGGSSLLECVVFGRTAAKEIAKNF